MGEEIFVEKEEDMKKIPLGNYRGFDLWWTEYYESTRIVGGGSAHRDRKPYFAIEEAGTD